MRLMFVNMILRRGFRDLPTFASAVVRGLFVDWPALRNKIWEGHRVVTMDIAITNQLNYQQAVRGAHGHVREHDSCMLACSQT